MAVRLARNLIATASRSAARPNAAARNIVGRRPMSSSHGHAYQPSSDKPWAIASAAVFGPLLLYLLSPSSRKNFKAVHNDAHDFPGHHPRSHAQTTMKDSEGTVADVTESIQQAEVEDVPKAEPEQVSSVNVELAIVEQVTPQASPEAEPQTVAEVDAAIAAEDADASAAPVETSAPAEEAAPAPAAEATTAEDKPEAAGQPEEKASDPVEPPKEQATKEA